MYKSPRRQVKTIETRLGESTAKKNHSSSSQVNNFSRDDYKDSNEKSRGISIIGKNIHMRETFKCGEESSDQKEKLGFSFLHNQKQQPKESVALWGNVYPHLASPQKMKQNSKSQNKENKFKSTTSRSGRRNHNPFNDSRESQDNRINSSKTKLIKINPSPQDSMNFLSHEKNLSSITNNNKFNQTSQKNFQNLRPIWQNSPLTSFNQVQSFRSGDREMPRNFEKNDFSSRTARGPIVKNKN